MYWVQKYIRKQHSAKKKHKLQSLKQQSENRQAAIALFKDEVAVMSNHDLFRQTQAYARSIRFGGVERNEDFLGLA